MSSQETRSNSALFKRADQLKRWEEYDTKHEPVSPKESLRKIKFSSGCVFLAACAAAEKDEVIKLLDQGADIDTANVDGLTALHQACIDDNLDMVEFLVERGADVNRGDNEGWTPLHATASCGFVSIAKYLLEQGSHVAAVNCDGELALDITDSEPMRTLLQTEIDRQGIDCDLVRNEEKRLMLDHAMDWFATKSASVNECSPNTGATPLHVACAKGYVDVIKVLLQCVDVDIDKQDADGWTPLHAAAHWGQREASALLTEHLADMDFKNYVGQTAFDVAASDMYHHLEALSKAQNHEALLVRRRRKQGLSKKRPDSVGAEEETETAETPTKVQRLEQQQQINDDKQPDTLIINNTAEVIVEKKNRANVLAPQNVDSALVGAPLDAGAPSPAEEPRSVCVKADEGGVTVKGREDVNEQDNKLENDVKEGHGLKPSKSFNSKDRDGIEVKLRKNYSFHNDPLFCERYREVRARIQATSSLPVAQSRPPTSNYIIPPTAVAMAPVPTPDQQTPIRRHSNPVGRESDQQGRVDVGVNVERQMSPPVASPATSPPPMNPSMKISGVSVPIINVATQPHSENGSKNGDSPSAGLNRLTMIKNFFKSFVPPIRDEESETQRKARAKKVRETRRSTQGVTLEEIKSAEQLVKNNQINNNNNDQPPTNDICITATITQFTTAAPTVANTTPIATTTTSTNRQSNVASLSSDPPDLTQSTTNVSTQERRPSWRLRLDNGSKFKLEDAATTTDITSNTVDTAGNTPSFVRRTAVGNTGGVVRPNSAPVHADTVSTEATVTLPLRNKVATIAGVGGAAKTTTTPQIDDDKEQDKENDARNVHQMAIPMQAAIQRRKRSKRRSTGGVVQLEGLDQELEADKDASGGGDCVPDDSTKIYQQIESGTERCISGRSSSRSDLTARCENGDIDYKRMYELAVVDNDRLKDKLRKSDEELRDTKQTLERLNTVTSKNSLSELEKRERRAMERKLSEMEEELKHLDLLKTENQRLKDENGALIRVISKLSK